MASDNSNGSPELERIRSSSPTHRDEEFIARLKALIDAVGGQHPFSRLAGVSQGALQRYLAGGDPSRRMLLAISKAAHVRLEWLATGVGPMRGESDVQSLTINAPIAIATDHRLIGRLTEKIMLVYKEMGVSIALHQAAERAAQEHDRIVAAIADPDDRLIQIGEVVAELRHELRAKTADPAHSKRQA